MTWADFYLICFIVGFTLSLISFALGGLHLPWDTPHWVDHFTHHSIASHDPSAASDQPSYFNFPTMMTFLAWFGGIGYLLSHVYGVWYLYALLIALVSGVAGASLVFLFFARVLIPHDHTMRPADYKMEGKLATVSSAIREGGTGEIMYSQGGTRRGSSARSDDGTPIAKGEEVVVTRYEKGIAYVCRWKNLVDGQQDEP